MRDIDPRLAEALHESARKNHNLGEGPLRAVCQSVESHEPRAEAIAATPAGASLLADAAKGADPAGNRIWVPDDRPDYSPAVMSLSQAIHEVRRNGGDFGEDRTGDLSRRLVHSLARQGMSIVDQKQLVRRLLEAAMDEAGIALLHVPAGKRPDGRVLAAESGWTVERWQAVWGHLSGRDDTIEAAIAEALGDE